MRGLTSLGEPFCAIGSVVTLEAMRAMASAAGALGALAFSLVDPRRPGVDNCPEGLSAFGTGLAALPPGGSALVCRNGKSLAVFAMHMKEGRHFSFLTRTAAKRRSCHCRRLSSTSAKRAAAQFQS